MSNIFAIESAMCVQTAGQCDWFASPPLHAGDEPRNFVLTVESADSVGIEFTSGEKYIMRSLACVTCVSVGYTQKTFPLFPETSLVLTFAQPKSDLLVTRALPMPNHPRPTSRQTHRNRLLNTLKLTCPRRSGFLQSRLLESWLNLASSEKKNARHARICSPQGETSK